MSTFELSCEHCGSRYAIPVGLREQLRGRIVTCTWCMREWTPLPVELRDPSARARGDAFGQPPFPLHSYLQASAYAPAATPATAESPVVRSTTQFVQVEPSGAPANLRVSASGPEFELKAVYELGDRSFLVGRRGCHLELPQAISLPERAIRIRADGVGFEYEGIDGFLVPVGASWQASGRIEPGARLDLLLSPYRIAMKASRTPGLSIPDLESAAAALPAPSPYPPSPTQTLAAPAPPPPAIDMNSTLRDLSAFALEARKYSSPLESLDVGLVHLEPPLQGETVWIRKSPTLIGRTSGDILLADPRVSGKHAQIDVLGIDQYSIKDLASTNGTAVNDRPTSTTRLKDGDIVSFGGVRLQFLARQKRR